MPSTPNTGPLTKIYHWCRRRLAALSWGVVAVSAVMTLVLGVIGFTGLNEEPLPISTRIYLAVQLLTMESGAVVEQSQVSWSLELARWAGVVTSLGTILNTLLAVFAQRIHRFLLRRISEHAVIIGAGQSGTQLATDLLADGYRVTVIESDDGNPTVAALVERGIDEVIGDARELETLEAAAVHNAEIMVVVAGTDIRNLEIVSAIGQSSRKRNRDASPLRCYVHIADERLGRLHERRLNHGLIPLPLETSFFNRFTNSARLLLAETPLDRERIVAGDDRQVHLVIVDLSPLGEALLKQALAVGHYANNVPLAVTVIDESASQKEQSILVRIPELHQCADLTFVDGGMEQETVRQNLKELLNNPQQMTSVAFCQEDAQSALTGCMDLIPLLTVFNKTVFVNLAEDERAATSLNISQDERIRLIPFGNSEVACSTQAVVHRDLDILAKNIHNEYRAKRTRDGDSEQDYPAMKPWEQLDGELRDMNRQQADHIPVKLRALGCRMLAGSGEAGELRLSDDEIEALAKTEHRRWCASRRLAGWSFASTRNNVAKLHPDLVSWEELDESTRDYDREPVRNLATLLATIGFRIEKTDMQPCDL
jgi:hypothetical protein